MGVRVGTTDPLDLRILPMKLRVTGNTITFVKPIVYFGSALDLGINSRIYPLHLSSGSICSSDSSDLGEEDERAYEELRMRRATLMEKHISPRR